MSKPKVLFLCTRNSARSQMAEGFLKYYADDKYEVYSAGLTPSKINPLTIKVMKEKGIDISNQYSKGFEDFDNKRFGFLITVCSKAEENCPVFPGISIRMFWPFDDPDDVNGTEEEKLNKFREVRDEIENKVKEFVENDGNPEWEKKNFLL